MLYEGNDLNDYIVGGNEDDTIYGKGGNDRLDGGAGYDTIYGGADNDVLTGGVDHFGQLDKLYGEAGNDILYATGWHGGDYLYGGAGDDSYVVETFENGFDPASPTLIEYAGGGTDTVYALSSWTLGDNFENLLLLGTGAFDGTGNSQDNLLIGNEANNTLVGGFGNDQLMGYGGSDRLNGYGTVNTNDMQFDKLAGGAGTDYFVLGGSWGVSYVETGDGYATITDWNAAEDWIEVKGSTSKYSIEYKQVSGIGSSAQDTEIYYTSPNGSRDRIAIVQDTTNVYFSDFKVV